VAPIGPPTERTHHAISVFDADPTLMGGDSVGRSDQDVTTVSPSSTIDKEATVSIGDVCVAPSNRNIAGSAPARQPAQLRLLRDGRYKSTDGGKSWKNMGLEKPSRSAASPFIRRIRHRLRRALGRLYGNNPERGLSRQRRRQVVEKVLFLNDRTGVIDLASPSDPDTRSSLWERRRDGSIPIMPASRRYDGYDPSFNMGEAAASTNHRRGKAQKIENACRPARRRVGLDYFRKTEHRVRDRRLRKDRMGTPPKETSPGDRVMGFFGEDVKGAPVSP